VQKLETLLRKKIIKEADLAETPDMPPRYPGRETLSDKAKYSILFNLICFSDLLSFNQTTFAV